MKQKRKEIEETIQSLRMKKDALLRKEYEEKMAYLENNWASIEEAIKKNESKALGDLLGLHRPLKPDQSTFQERVKIAEQSNSEATDFIKKMKQEK